MQINIQKANSYSDLSKEVNNFQCEFCNSNLSLDNIYYPSNFLQVKKNILNETYYLFLDCKACHTSLTLLYNHLNLSFEIVNQSLKISNYDIEYDTVVKRVCIFEKNSSNEICSFYENDNIKLSSLIDKTGDKIKNFLILL